MKSFTIFFSILHLTTIVAFAQKPKTKSQQEIKVPMQPAYWEYDTANIKFIAHRNVNAAQVKKGAPMFLKNQKFSNGTIEYDVELGQGFPGISFRLSDDRKNGETFYLRYFGATSPESRVTMQYAAIIDGVPIWNLSDEYQTGAKLNIPGWNHVKLVVSGRQMEVYVNDMIRQALVVPALESETRDGGILFAGGEVTIANLVIRPGVVENLSPEKGYISVYNDTRYIRNWQVSQPKDFPFGKEVVTSMAYLGGTQELPDSTAKWTTIAAEDRGIVNLTRLFGHAENNGRRLAWLKTTIYSDKEQGRVLNFGFCDEVWLYINGQVLYVDKNHFGTLTQKMPRGRCTIENAVVRLPLKQGKNEILIGVAAYFYGWGIVARLDDTEGIHFCLSGQ